jgi:post-segregation antitoxin (ccd killing protein)
MPKVSVYLPDELYREVRAAGLPISSITQRALEDALAAARNASWVERVRSRPCRVHEVLDTLDALHAARDDFGA